MKYEGKDNEDKKLIMKYEGKENSVGEPQVFAQLTKYETKVSKLAEIVAILESRLRSISRIKPPSEIQVDGKKEPKQLVPLAQEIKNNNDKIAEQINIIESIIQRLEV